MNIDAGEFFEIKGLIFQGGSIGLRLGSGSLVTDTVKDALFEDLEVKNTRDSLITANQGPTGQLKIHDRLTFRRLKLHHPLNTAGKNECMYLGSNLDGANEKVIVQNSIIEYCYCHDTVPAEPGFGAGLQLKPGSNRNIVRFSKIFSF